jgi:predicted dehydrogenase
MKALLAGFGGIGSNVYYPELQKLGYEIDILDSFAANVKFKNHTEIKERYEIAIVSTPNFTHAPIAIHLAQNGTKSIFIEKPGLINAQAWWDLCSTFRDTKFHLVKNNLYRTDYGNIMEHLQTGKVIGVDINWINNNRIPNPGSWFTTKKLAFGGVSRDLMPHMYCFAVKMFGPMTVENVDYKQTISQRWFLDNITNTDYGIVNPKGKYDVDDEATATGNIDNISLRMHASWKAGYDKQSITLFLKDGSTYEWNFGLCPADAYGRMLQDDADSTILDMDIHYFLENFIEDEDFLY